MKRRTLLISTALAMTSLAACGSSGGSGGTGDGSRLRIGLSVNDTTSFVNEGKDALQAYADANDIELILTDPKGDVTAQASQIDQFVLQQLDGIMVIAIQPDALNAQAASAKAAGIPLLNVNSAMSSPDTAGSVEPDDTDAGRKVAQAMCDELGGSGGVVILEGPLGNSAQVLRKEGIDAVLAEYPDVTVLASDTANWSRDEAVNKTANWLTAHGDAIQGIIAENDDMALGALQALREVNMSVPIVGIDGIRDGLQAVEDGDFIGTVVQNGSLELSLSLALTAAIINETAPEKHIQFKMPYVNQENIDLYIRNAITEKEQFIEAIPEIVDRNLESGDYSNEEF